MADTVTSDTIDQVADEVGAGNSVVAVLELFGIAPMEFYRALDKYPEACSRYERARQARAEGLVEEIITIADCENDSQKARNRIDARKWYAGKMMPGKYGERIELNVTGQVDLRAAMADATLRLRPVSDQHQVTDAEYAVLPAPTQPGASDKTSDAPENPPKKQGSIFD